MASSVCIRRRSLWASDKPLHPPSPLPDRISARMNGTAYWRKLYTRYLYEFIVKGFYKVGKGIPGDTSYYSKLTLKCPNGMDKGGIADDGYIVKMYLYQFWGPMVDLKDPVIGFPKNVEVT